MTAMVRESTSKVSEGSILNHGFFTRRCMINAHPIRKAMPRPPAMAEGFRSMPMSSSSAKVSLRIPNKSRS